jgi:hypothetical protein
MAVNIIKSSGKSEQFEIQKLVNSLARSGAPSDVALDIAREVEKNISPSFHTKAIYRLARKLLRQYNRASGMKYSLKKALYELGPSGYPFEKYIARILKVNGYSVEVNKIMEGYCVKHEVDVFARREDEHCIIECKYHSNAGTSTDVKIALYVHSRVEDIRKACEQYPEDRGKTHQGWLVTNTRCTTDAVKYAECVGLRILSWRYPLKESLEKMIDDKKLYPVTVLPAARKRNLELLFLNDFILVQDISGLDGQTFFHRSGLDAETASELKKQADELCPSCV